MTVIEPLKLSMAFSNFLYDAMQNISESLQFSKIWGISLPMNANTFLPMLILLSLLNFVLCVHNSFRNLAYIRICLIASRGGVLTFTFLKVSKISLLTSSIFFLGIILCGNERGIGACYELLCALGLEGSVSSSSFFLFGETRPSSQVWP